MNVVVLERMGRVDFLVPAVNSVYCGDLVFNDQCQLTAQLLIYDFRATESLLICSDREYQAAAGSSLLVAGNASDACHP